jgi:hypothetical protein
MKQTFSVKNWEQFQHYKDRNPPWIKLHNHLLDDYDFECLPDATKCHLLCIWMLASRTSNEMIFDNVWVKRKIGANSNVDLELLRSAGFIEVHSKEQDASMMLVSEEKRRDREEDNNVINDICQQVADAWNDSFPELSGVAKVSQRRKANINATIKEFKKSHNMDKIETWVGLFEYMKGSDFLMGRAGEWRCDFDFVINKNNMLKIIEGKYENART